MLITAVLVSGCSVVDAGQLRGGGSPDPSAIASPSGVGIRESTAPDIDPPGSPSPTAVPSTPAPALAAFALNLYEVGDFVPQYTFEWCVAASIQMAYNLVEPETRSARSDQQELWERARTHSSNSFGGANPWGWAAVLDEVGIGPYDLVSISDYAEALRVAAAAIRETQRPVGLVMWRGRHAWVMSGFESVGDPAVDAAFRVTGVRVLDPLYPHGSGIWGPSPEPNSLLSSAELATQFVIRDSRRWSSGLPAGYLLVLPRQAQAPAAHGRWLELAP
ncbi:MAG TPA: hypothetical protein VK736_05710 [Candidatus Binatia bacterium]|nr:hypothetical protein [Candidatus Binatia bacterium]